MNADTTVSSADFRATMRHHAGGVTVITTGQDANRTGMTATSVTSFSDTPPTLIFGLNQNSSTWMALTASGEFCVNILSSHQEAIARNFSGFGGLSGPERYRDGEWEQLGPRALALRGTVASMYCVVEDEIRRHTHSAIIGRVVTMRMSENAIPLIYWNGIYSPLQPFASTESDGQRSMPAPRHMKRNADA